MKQGIAQVAHFPHLNMNGCVCEARAHARASQTHPFMCRRSQIASPEKGKSDLCEALIIIQGEKVVGSSHERVTK